MHHWSPRFSAYPSQPYQGSTSTKLYRPFAIMERGIHPKRNGKPLGEWRMVFSYGTIGRIDEAWEKQARERRDSIMQTPLEENYHALFMKTHHGKKPGLNCKVSTVFANLRCGRRGDVVYADWRSKFAGYEDLAWWNALDQIRANVIDDGNNVFGDYQTRYAAQ